MDSPSSARGSGLRVLGLLFCLALLYSWTQSRFGLIDYDEAAYAEIAKEMTERGDYVAPELNGEPFFEKPPLLYWTEVLGYRVFGLAAASARFLNGLAAIALLAVLYAAARRPLGERAALASAAILGTSAEFFGVAVVALTDMLLALFLALSVACLHEAFERDRAGRAGGTAWFLLGAAAASVAVLAKGLVGLALPACAGLVFLASVRRLGSAFAPARLLGGTLIALCLGGSWYLLVGFTHEGGFAFLKELLVEHHFGRALQEKEGHGGPFFYYVGVLALGLLPWSPLLVPALARRGLFDAATERGRFLRLCGCFAAITLAVFTISATKLPNYALPIFPFAALVLGDLFARLGSAPSRTERAALCVAQVLCAALGVFALLLPQLLPRVPGWVGEGAEKEPGLRFPIELGAAPYAAALIALGTAAVSCALLRRARPAASWATLGAGAFALFAVAAAFFVPRYDAHFLAPLRAAAREAADHVRPGEPLVLVGIRKRPSINFASGLRTEFAPPRKLEHLRALFAPGSTRVGLATELVFEPIERELPELRAISHHGGWVLFRRG